MASWDYVNIGASAKKENMNYVKQIFDCFNIDYENIDDLSINDYGERTPHLKDFKPDIIGNADNATISCKDLYFLLNNLFEDTYVFWEHEEGSTISDYSSESEEIYNPVKKKIFSANSPDSNFDDLLDEYDIDDIDEFLDDFEDVAEYKEAIKKLLPYSKFVKLFKIEKEDFEKDEYDSFIFEQMIKNEFPDIDYDDFNDAVNGCSEIDEDSYYDVTCKLSDTGVVCFKAFWQTNESDIEMQEVNPEIIEMLIESATSKGYTELVALINEKIK